MKRLPMTRMGVANVLWETFRKAKEYLDKQNRGEEQDYDANMEAIIPALKGEIPCKIHCTQYDMITAIEVSKAYGSKILTWTCMGCVQIIWMRSWKVDAISAMDQLQPTVLQVSAEKWM